MLTGVITGKNGTMKIGPSGTAYGSLTEVKIKNWQLTISGGALDISDCSSGDARDKVPGKRYSWNGSAEAILRAGEWGLHINTQVSMALVAEDTPGDEVYWKGEAIIINIGVNTPIEGEDVVTVPFNFEGAGALTRVDNSDN
jgi:hypothetical protein